jgi:hypothetical protein
VLEVTDGEVHAMAQAQWTTNHDFIQRWAEERGAKPAAVTGTGDEEDPGIIRLDFPGYSGEGKLEPISWDEWFAKFDENGLALLYQEETAEGEQSNFNKLVKRETAAEHSPRSRAA